MEVLIEEEGDRGVDLLIVGIVEDPPLEEGGVLDLSPLKAGVLDQAVAGVDHEVDLRE